MAYTVQKGDNLSSIANKYGTTWQDIYNTNRELIDNDARAHGVTKNFQNYIYANQQLNIPGVDNVAQSAPVASQPVVEQPAQVATQPVKSTQELANEYATAQTAGTSNDTQALLAQYEKIAEQQKQALQNSKLQAQNQINSQRQGVMDAYQDNARQAYINSMLAKQNVGQQLSQAGLNTSGLVGSAYANVESAYGNSLASLQANRDNSIRNIDTQLNNSDLEYAIQENKLLSDIEQAKLELQKYGNELAYNRYQNALSNYMNFANMDYQKQQDATKLDYQRQRDAIADEQWQKEYDLALRQLEETLKKNSVSSKSSGSSGSSKSAWSSFTDTGSETEGGENTSSVINNNNINNTSSSNNSNKKTETQVERSAGAVERILKSTSRNSQQRQMLLQQLVRAGEISASDFAVLMAQ